MYMEIQSNGEKVEVGNQLRLYTTSTLNRDKDGKPAYTGKVEKIEKVRSAATNGLLLTAYLEGYGEPQPFYEPGGVILPNQIDERRNNSGMPAKFMSKSGRDFHFSLYGEDTNPQKKICNAYIQNFKSGIRGTGLYIYSKTPGSGKTLLACCIANEILIQKDISVKFINLADFIELSFSTSKTEEDRYRLKAVKEATLLILDDLGTHSSKDSIDNALFSLIEHRNKNTLPTIYTSNLNREELKSKLHDRVVSRIFDNTIPLAMPEKSIRDELSDRMVENRIRELLSNSADIESCFD